MISENYLSLEYLQYFINIETFKAFNINEKTANEEIVFIFKQKN